MGVIADHLMKRKRKRDKMAKTMSEYAAGTLHSGSKTGPLVTDRKQAIAIGLSQMRRHRG